MNYFLALLVAFCTITTTHGSVTIASKTNVLESCSQPGSAMDIRNIELIPNPPVVGKNLTGVITAKLNRPVLEGTKAHITVTLGSMVVYDGDSDFCGIFTTCPIEDDPKKPIILNIPTQQAGQPAPIPGVTLNIKFDMKDKEGRPVGCLQGPIKFSRS